MPADADSLAALGELASAHPAPPLDVDEQPTVAVPLERTAAPSRRLPLPDRLAAIPALRAPTSVPAVAAVRALPRRTQLGVLAAASVAAGLLAGLVVPVATAAPAPTASAPRVAASQGSGPAAAATRSTRATQKATTTATRPTQPAEQSTAAKQSKAAKPAKVGSAAPAAAQPVAAASSVTSAAAVPALTVASRVDWSAAAGPRARAAAGPVAATAAAPAREAAPTRPSAATIAAARAYKPTRKLPADSGTGRRIVYSQHRGHVWVVGSDGFVVRDYPVTGRIGRPAPGSYRVFSKSPTAVNPVAKVRFDQMVRFAHGITGAAIGFHTIPRWYDGRPIQRVNQLGQMIGAGGCVRQSTADARWLYRWAKIGERVVVLA